MFEFLSMIGSYESRKVSRHEDPKTGLVVSTAAVTDSQKLFESAVLHPRYNKGEWVIVECYETREQAQQGHEHWVQVMTAEELPASLVDVSEATIRQLVNDGLPEVYPIQPPQPKEPEE